MKIISLLVVGMIAATLVGCARPAEVRSLATAAMPVATGLQKSATGLEIRFKDQQGALAFRANELAQEVDIAAAKTRHIEAVWRFSDQPQLAKQLSQLRERDDVLRANPTGQIAAAPATKLQPPTIDQTALKAVITNLDAFSKDRKTSPEEIWAFMTSVNTELSKLEKEQGPGQE